MKKYILIRTDDACSTERSYYIEDFDILGVYDTEDDAYAEHRKQRVSFMDVAGISFDVREVKYYPTEIKC